MLMMDIIYSVLMMDTGFGFVPLLLDGRAYTDCNSVVRTAKL